MNSSIILLIFFLISVFITLPLPSLLSRDSYNEHTYDDTKNNSAMILSGLHSFRNLDLKNQLNDINFIGRWNAGAFDYPQFDYFDHPSGKMSLYFYDNKTDNLNVRINIRDGDYLDQKVVGISDFPLIIDNQEAENVWSSVITQSFTEYYEYDNKRTISNCDMNYTFKMVNSVDGSSFIPHLSTAKGIFEIKSEMCKIDLKAELALGDWSSQSQAIYYSLTVTIVCVIKLVSIIKLIKYGNDNEADLNKISIITVSIATIMDTYMCLFHLYMALYIESFFHFFITPAFWYFILFSIFEMRFLLMLWKARYFSNYESIRDVRKGLIFFYIKLYLGLFACLALLYFFVLKNWLIIIFHLLFIPQIIHSAIRRQKSDFISIYIFGFLAIRLIYPLYFRGCPENLFSLTPSNNFVISICSLVCLQILIYFLQWKLGSRFFIPSICLPPKYKYFRELKVDLKTETDFDDCVICMNHLHEDPSDKTQPLLNSDDTVIVDVKDEKVVTRKIMITPCGHKYHIPCLKKWIEIKMECPTCRKQIPPVE